MVYVYLHEWLIFMGKCSYSKHTIYTWFVNKDPLGYSDDLSLKLTRNGIHILLFFSFGKLETLDVWMTYRNCGFLALYDELYMYHIYI